MSVTFLLAFALSVLSQHDRTVSISADTQSMRVTFTSPGQTWDIAGATLCQPSVPCPASGQVTTVPSIVFQDRARIALWLNSAGTHVILELLDDSVPPLPANTRFALPLAAFEQVGAQAFVGELTIGETVRTGRKRFLTSGTYRFEELDTILFSGQEHIYVVASGSLLHGDQATIVAMSRGRQQAEEDVSDPGFRPQTVFGHVVLVEEDGRPVLRVTGTSDDGDVAVALTRAGLSTAYPIRPAWTDSVIASPSLLAITLVWAFFAGLIQTAVVLSTPRSGSKSQD